MSERTGALSGSLLDELIDRYTKLANKAIARPNGNEVAEAYNQVAADLRAVASNVELTEVKDPNPTELPPGTVMWVATSTSEYHALVKPNSERTLCGKTLRRSSLNYVSNMRRAPSSAFKACGKCRILDRLSREDEIIVNGHQARTARVLVEKGVITMHPAEGARLNPQFVVAKASR
jgi:hypothetical protein